MSYAIETKKRKFERILETLTDTAPAPAPAKDSSKSQSNLPTSLLSRLSASDLSKRRRITPTLGLRLDNASTASLSTHYLPSSRTAFLDRLESFRHITQWHIPSTSSISAASWAKRGWICQDVDTVSCPSCKERVFVNLETQDKENRPNLDNSLIDAQADAEEEDPLMLVNEIYDGLVKRYTEMIVTAHKDTCPWRRRGCDASIQRIEGLLNTTNTFRSLKVRYDTMANCSDEIPKIASLPSTESWTIQEHDLQHLLYEGQLLENTDVLRLAICGWQRKDADVVECKNCFRSLGLWLYRGVDPTMEHLDPIDSHLDYCPWRTSEAQDTELITGRDHKKQSVPGWLLVYLAISKRQVKGRGNRESRHETDTPQSIYIDEAEGARVQPDLTPEQREKKMKDLLRRIKELKKPFNVRNLLRKKDKN